MPWDLINTFTDSDYERMRGKMIFRPITPDARISWIWCPSLIEPGKEICIPAQCIFTGLHFHDEIPFMTSFSKGTASHTAPKLALRSAILEAVEADALMIRWYALTKARRVVLDDPVLQDLIAEIFSEVDVEIVPYEYTMPGMPGHVFAVALMSRGTERPAVLLGTGAGLVPGATLYELSIEAVAIYYIGYNGPALQPRDYLTDIDDDSHANLDSNVAYWASADDADKKRAFMRNMVEGQVSLSALPATSRRSTRSWTTSSGNCGASPTTRFTWTSRRLSSKRRTGRWPACSYRNSSRCRCRPSLTAAIPGYFDSEGWESTPSSLTLRPSCS